MDVASIQRALATMQKQASETKTATRAVDIDDIIQALSKKVEDTIPEEGLKKEAYLRRRSNLLTAKMLAGIDALASQG